MPRDAVLEGGTPVWLQCSPGPWQGPPSDHPARAVPLGHSHFSLSLRQTLAHLLPAPNKCEFYLLCWQQRHRGCSALHPHSSTPTLALAAATPQEVLSPAHFPWLVAAPWVQCRMCRARSLSLGRGETWVGQAVPSNPMGCVPTGEGWAGLRRLHWPRQCLVGPAWWCSPGAKHTFMPR